MIEFVQGELVEVETQYIVIDHHGLGYRIFCPNPYSLQTFVDQSIRIYTYQHVRQDLIRLYGFQTREERTLFEKLLNVSGIGPKGALAILAFGQPEQVVHAIETEDEAFLVKFPGVGKKTARQMILDLKGKLDEFAPNLLREQSDQTGKKHKDHNEHLEEALEALRALGYVERELKKIRPHLEKEELLTDEYIKKALQMMLQ
ncbi:Holliday junction branch migration protein RuvA [bacterium LRH843]|nr:Holliday junction branch migration protein RuvA [bacterium LRH843]